MARREFKDFSRVVTAGLMLISFVLGVRPAFPQYPASPQVSKDGTGVLLQDYAGLPLSSRTAGTYPPPINFASQLGRVNFLRSEPPAAPQSSSRFFVNDLNRNLYMLDKASRLFTPFINFEEVFPNFDNDPGFAGGLVTFAFDPEYADNGKFYTVHTEDPNKSNSAAPTNNNLPGLDLTDGYTTTTAVNPPAGGVAREAVLVEWTDTNLTNTTFEGTAREILRVGFNSNIHPMADLLFNPLAQPDDSDYRNLYIAVGDGGAGERSATRSIPQRLDALPGKILRVTPDINLRPTDELSANGRYRIPTTGPDPNPFVSLTLNGLKKEIFAYGLRNPHRMSWDPASNTLLVTDIGLFSWEEVNIAKNGTNYGYSEREGIEQLFIGGTNDGKTGSQTSPPTPFPNRDSLTVSGIATPVTPVYPVAAYSHRDGDGISSGFVYRGSLMPQLNGKYIFGDITTGRLFYSDLEEMAAADDDDRTSLAEIHELQVVFDSPHDTPDQGPGSRRLFDIVAEEYTQRGGNAAGRSALPGSAPATAGDDPDGTPYGGGRTDIRLAVGGDDEIYVLSKSDGMIRQLIGVVTVDPGANIPDISVTPSSLDFGSVVVGKSSADQIVTVRNDGVVNLNIGAISVGSANANQFVKAADNCSKKNLGPGASCTVAARFKPTSSGAKTGILIIPSNDPDENPFNVSLSGTGGAGSGTPDVTVTPLSINFGNVKVKKVVEQTVTVKNDGTADLTLAAITLGGANADQFNTGADKCSKKTLAPNASCTVNAKFKATSTGAKTATLTIPSNDPDENPVSVSLSGTGTP